MNKVQDIHLAPGEARVVIEHRGPTGQLGRIEVFKLHLDDSQSVLRVYEEEKGLAELEREWLVSRSPRRSAEVSLTGRLLPLEDGTQVRLESEASERDAFYIGDDLYKIDPTSCRCGGHYAWMRQRESGAWEMVGCVCHTLPTGQRIQFLEEDPEPGDYIAMRSEWVQSLIRSVWTHNAPIVRAVVAMARKSGVIE